MEKNKELRGAHITEVHFGVSEQECKEKCLDSVYIFCRRLEYTEESKKCVIIDEDSVSQDYALTDTNSNATYYELFCIDGGETVRQELIGVSNREGDENQFRPPPP